MQYCRELRRWLEKKFILKVRQMIWEGSNCTSTIAVLRTVLALSRVAGKQLRPIKAWLHPLADPHSMGTALVPHVAVLAGRVQRNPVGEELICGTDVRMPSKPSSPVHKHASHLAGSVVRKHVEEVVGRV